RRACWRRSGAASGRRFTPAPSTERWHGAKKNSRPRPGAAQPDAAPRRCGLSARTVRGAATRSVGRRLDRRARSRVGDVSGARQYDLKRRAQALGWTAEQLIIVDEDLGLSGASAAQRSGFQRMVAEVGLGRVGVVMGLEVSRLARNSADWHRLLEICALSETLILDEDGIYDPSHFNDRLLLGLKGTMSEAELHLLRARLLGGQLNKARRGERWIRPP